MLGLIPARGGSSGIPRKNIALLAGRPLLAYTCEAALGSRRLTRVLLSTDAEDIATETHSWAGKLPEPDEDGMYLLKVTSFYKVATFRLEILLQ